MLLVSDGAGNLNPTALTSEHLLLLWRTPQIQSENGKYNKSEKMLFPTVIIISLFYILFACLYSVLAKNMLAFQRTYLGGFLFSFLNDANSSLSFFSLIVKNPFDETFGTIQVSKR